MNDDIVRRSTELLEAALDDELVALHVGQGRCYGFNSTAARIWSLIENPIRFHDLRSALMQEFEVDEATCSRELDAVLEDLQRNGLVTRSAHSQ